MPPEDRDLEQGLKLAVDAVVCAILTATLVIAVGGALLGRPPPDAESVEAPAALAPES